jgi:hypothetical protein
VICTESFAAHDPVRLHVVLHVPPLHEGVPASEVHTCPHEPQLLTVSTAVSQPFARLPSQSPKPALHEGAHAPAMQFVVPFGFTHATVHVPQWSVVVSTFTSQPFEDRPSQSANPGSHANWQAPPWHDAEALPNAQTFPQNRQFAVEVFRSVSQPVPASAPQLPVPGAQDDVAQTPAWQTALPLSTVQASSHLPQWVGSACRLVSQPLALFPSQSP